MSEKHGVEAVERYVSAVRSQFSSGHAGEHAYRPALQQLMGGFDECHPVNDPKRSAHGNPDFIFLKKSNPKIILGYGEAKDISVDLDKVEKTNQMQRYSGYENLFLTNYLDFRFYRNGEKYKSVTIGHVQDGAIHLDAEQYAQLIDELQAFLDRPPERIKSGKRLAQIMGGRPGAYETMSGCT